MSDLITQDNSIQTYDNFDKAMSFAEKLSKSALIPYKMRGKPNDIVVTILFGQEIGLTPMRALSEVYVVNGIPSVSGKTMLGLIRRYAPNAHIEFPVQEKDRVVCEMARDKTDVYNGLVRGLYRSEWTLEMAQKRGFTGKDNWKNNPTMMLRWRAVSECSRMVFPDILGGFYEKDEVYEIAEEQKVTLSKENEMKENVYEVQNKFAEPEQVISFSEEKEIKVDHPEIVSKIDNRDWVIPMGTIKGKTLKEIPVEELRKRQRTVEDWGKNNKLNDAQKGLLAQVSAYIAQYDKLVLESNGKDKVKQSCDMCRYYYETKEGIPECLEREDKQPYADITQGNYCKLFKEVK